MLPEIVLEGKENVKRKEQFTNRVAIIVKGETCFDTFRAINFGRPRTIYHALDRMERALNRPLTKGRFERHITNSSIRWPLSGMTWKTIQRRRMRLGHLFGSRLHINVEIGTKNDEDGKNKVVCYVVFDNITTPCTMPPTTMLLG